MSEKESKVMVTITIDRSIFELIEQRRGLIPRSRYVERILRSHLQEGEGGPEGCKI